MTEDDANFREERPRRHLFAPLISLAAVAAALAFLYVTKASHRNEAAADAGQCTQSREIAAKLKPLVHGEIAALAVATSPQPMPALTFSRPDGRPVTLANFRGRDVLLNLWATWCVPCRREMPSLDRLEGESGGPDFEVVAVNIDTARLERPKAFLTEIGVKNLALYTDSTADVFETLKQEGKVLGLPTTILVGKDGCAIGTMAGPAEWDSDEALALIKAEKS